MSDPEEKITVTEYTGLLSLIAGLLHTMETRIIERISDQNRLATERWARHDVDAHRTMADWDARFGRLEAKVDEHHHKAELQEVSWDARISPLRNLTHLLANNWRSILLGLFALLGFLAVALDVVARYMGID